MVRGSGLERLRVWDRSQRESEAGTVSLNGEEMGFHRGSGAQRLQGQGQTESKRREGGI